MPRPWFILLVSWVIRRKYIDTSYIETNSLHIGNLKTKNRYLFFQINLIWCKKVKEQQQQQCANFSQHNLEAQYFIFNLSLIYEHTKQIFCAKIFTSALSILLGISEVYSPTSNHYSSQRITDMVLTDFATNIPHWKSPKKILPGNIQIFWGVENLISPYSVRMHKTKQVLKHRCPICPRLICMWHWDRCDTVCLLISLMF